MKSQTLIRYLLPATCLLLLVAFPVQAADQPLKVLYQNSFATDPHWTTNNPRNDYWDPGLEMYHFAIEPSTGAYAYVPISGYDGGPFTFEYDVILNDVDSGATFRLGFSGDEMDPQKGPNVLTEFTNAKFGQIMWLHLVTPGNKMSEVNSQKGDTLSSDNYAYEGPTVKYELNRTYHVTVDYNNDNNIVSMKVNEKTSGKEIWGYYVKSGEDLHGMSRIYLGSIGDYGMTSIYAKGYIDNVRLTTPGTAVATPTIAVTTATAQPTATATTYAITKKPTVKPTASVPTPYPTETQQSPVSPVTALAALGLAGLCSALVLKGRK